ncbi:MAG: putative Transglutaminase-like enzymeputative cysteine protease [Acidobacteria bacterium]|nr:putative Transglutaminase-like enzymeputative cysteine protease [Acidobacteriota bacterium]
MNRRSFLHRTGMTAAALAVGGRSGLLAQPDAPRWRVFEITTMVRVREPRGATRVWLPTPLAVAPYQHTMGDTYHPGGGTAVMIETNANEPDILGCSWDDGIDPAVTLVSRVATIDHAVDLTRPAVPPPPDLTALSRFLRPTRLIPIDGIVRTTADTIVKGAGTDIERARAIYDWIVEHTFRDPKTRGCGTGDIRFMLESGNLGGKCADLNGLFVGLCRAAGLPARDVYGLRVAPSARGFSSLGLSSADATKAQHCRAEVYLAGYGWVPVDPADVRKVALEEPPGGLAIDDERVRLARERLFGSWEMNWIAYNFANDVELRGSRRKPLGYFMYPQAETADGPLDSLDAERFTYSITVREVP